MSNNLRVQRRFPLTLRREQTSHVPFLAKLQRNSNSISRSAVESSSSSLADLDRLVVPFSWSKAEFFNPAADLSPTLEQIVFSPTAKGDELRASAKPIIDQALAHPLAQEYINTILKPIKTAILTPAEFESYLKSLGLFSETEIQQASASFGLATAVNTVINDVPHFVFNVSNFSNSSNDLQGTVFNELREIRLRHDIEQILGKEQAQIWGGSTAVQEFTFALDQIVYPELVNRVTTQNPEFSSMTPEQQFAQIQAYAQTMPPDELAALFNKAIFETRQLTGENYTKLGKNNLLDPEYVSGAADPNILLDLLQKDIFRTLGVNLKVRIAKDPSITSDNTEPRGPFASAFEVTSDLGEGQTAGSVITGGNEDLLLGTIGNDSIKAGIGTEVINGLKGDDSITGILGIKTIFGGQGDDSITGDGQEVLGNKGADTLTGGVGSDTLRGGQGNDILDGRGGPDTLTGDSGHDAVVYNKEYDSLILNGDVETIYIDPKEFNIDSATRGSSPKPGYEGVYMDGTLIANIPAGSSITLTTFGLNAESIKL